MFYELSNSLVGVCKDMGTNSSRTLTLDLTKYDKDTDEPPSRPATPQSLQVPSGDRPPKRARASGVDSPATIRTQ